MLMAWEVPTEEEVNLLVCPASLKDPAPLCAVQVVQVGWPQPSQTAPGWSAASGNGHVTQARSVTSFSVLRLEFWE